MNKLRKKPSHIFLNILEKYGSNIPDSAYLQIYTKIRNGRKVKLRNPLTFNDKINWIKLYDKNPLMTICADKLKVRDYVSEKIGSKYLVPVLWSGEDPDDIPFDTLPESFVLKMNNASGANKIVQDKKTINEEEIKRQFKIWRNKDNYTPKREWAYKKIPPRIICEQFLTQENNQELRDYRFFCFNGEARFIVVDFSITDKNNTRRNIYDLNWNLLNAEITYPKEESIILDKPSKLNEMIKLSEKLSKDFHHVRVDFYCINNNIYFGEMTFYHQSGMGDFEPISFGIEVGNMLELNMK